MGLSTFEDLYTLPRHHTFSTDQEDIIQCILEACPAYQRADLNQPSEPL